MREDADLSQKVVAEYLLCDQSLYSKYERDERASPMKRNPIHGGNSRSVR